MNFIFSVSSPPLHTVDATQVKIKGKCRNKTKQTTKFVLLSLPLLLCTVTATVIFICFLSDILLLQLVSK